MPSAIPFSKRTTAAVAIFSCLFIASPQGAQTLATNYTQLSSLAFEYGQLINSYHLLVHQDTANNEADLDAEVVAAAEIVANLKATLGTMTALGDNILLLAQMRSVVANALVNIVKAESFEDE